MLEKVKETVAEALGADIDTITAETSELQRPLEDLLAEGTSTQGVLKCEILAG